MVDAAKLCPYGKRTLERWLASYRKYGEAGPEPKSTEPKSQPNETSIQIKERMIEIRRKTKKRALKTYWQTKKGGVILGSRTVGKILKKEGLTRKYRVKRLNTNTFGPSAQPGELVEVDVKHVPGTIQNREYFQYAAVDVASRWRHMEIFDERSSYNLIRFLKIIINRFSRKIQAIKTDNHSTFTNYYTGVNKRRDLTIKTIHLLDVFRDKNNIINYLIDKGNPNQNGTVERNHREDEEKFYQQNRLKTIKDLDEKIRMWNDYYNNLEHCGLDGKAPMNF